MSIFGKPILTGVGKGSASGAVASFSDGAKGLPLRSLLAGIDPVQDLHGYDNPWPAGGGKNLFDSSLMADAGTEAKFITLNLKPNTAYTMSSDDPCKNNGEIVDLFFCNMDESVSSNLNGVKLNKSITRTSDANGQLRVGYRCYEAWITPEQLIAYHTQVEEGTATTYAPYSNICPISGWSAVNAWRMGKNLLPNISGARYVDSIYIGQADGTTYPLHLFAGVPYTISFQTNISGATAYAKENGGSTERIGVSGETYTPQKDMYVQMWVYGSGLTSVADWQLELGSIATSYAPYSGNQYTFTFPALGVNQWDEEWENGYFSFAGVPSASTTAIRSKNFCSCKGNTTYYFYFGGSGDSYVLWYDSTQTIIGNRVGAKNTTIVSPTNAAFFKVCTNASYGESYGDDISINYPSTDTSYHPYTNTVYGGILDVTNGVLTVDRAYALLNDPNKWANSTGTIDFVYNQEYTDRKLFDDSYTGTICSYLPVDRSVSQYARWIGAENYKFGLRMTSANLNQIRTDASAGKIAISYILATPITIPITPTQISTLLGANTIWADTGDVTVEYLKQTLMHIGSSVLI